MRGTLYAWMAAGNCWMRLGERGNVDHATRKFTRQYKPYYFSVCPEELAFSHFPADPRWQLLDKPVKESDFCRWPEVSLSPFVLGFQAADVCARLQDSSPRPLVETFACPGPWIRICSAPLEGKLRAELAVIFGLNRRDEQMAIVMGRRPQPLERVGTDFQCSGGRKGTPGRLSLAQRRASGQVVVWRIASVSGRVIVGQPAVAHFGVASPAARVRGAGRWTKRKNIYTLTPVVTLITPAPRSCRLLPRHPYPAMGV